MLKAVSFNSNKVGQNNGVFSEFNKNLVSNYTSKRTLKNDTVELNNTVAKKNFLNKKTLKTVGLIAGGIFLAVIVGKGIKNYSKTYSALKNTIQTREKNVTSDLEYAKKALITDVNSTDAWNTNGICFFGPNSRAKEEAITSFVGELAEAGYEIKHTPRANSTDFNSIYNTLCGYIREAKSLFQREKKRTAIVIRDLDQLAPRDSSEVPTSITGLLKAHGEHTKEKGLLFVTEAVNAKKVDQAVIRPGRMDTKLLIKPFDDEAMTLKKEYLDILQSLKKIK